MGENTPLYNPAGRTNRLSTGYHQQHKKKVLKRRLRNPLDVDVEDDGIWMPNILKQVRI